MGTSLEVFEPLYPSGAEVDPSLFARVQDDLRRVISQFASLEILDGQHLTGIDIVSGSTNLINHKLGRNYRGWVVTNIDAAATVHLDETSTAPKSLHLPLVTSATCVVGLWVF